MIFPSGFCWDERHHCRTSKRGLILTVLGAVDTPTPDEVHLIGVSSNLIREYFAELVSFVRHVKPIIPEAA